MELVDLVSSLRGRSMVPERLRVRPGVSTTRVGVQTTSAGGLRVGVSLRRDSGTNTVPLLKWLFLLLTCVGVTRDPSGSLD